MARDYAKTIQHKQKMLKTKRKPKGFPWLAVPILLALIGLALTAVYVGKIGVSSAKEHIASLIGHTHELIHHKKEAVGAALVKPVHKNASLPKKTVAVQFDFYNDLPNMHMSVPNDIAPVKPSVLPAKKAPAIPPQQKATFGPDEISKLLAEEADKPKIAPKKNGR